MAQLLCSVCSKKMITPKILEAHMKKQHTETVVEPVVETPVVETPAPEPISRDIVLRFSRPVEIRINGKPYFGKEVTTNDIAVASELVRIAREAYGDEVFGY